MSDAVADGGASVQMKLWATLIDFAKLDLTTTSLNMSKV
jgi:hypothetical protein